MGKRFMPSLCWDLSQSTISHLAESATRSDQISGNAQSGGSGPAEPPGGGRPSQAGTIQ